MKSIRQIRESREQVDEVLGIKTTAKAVKGIAKGVSAAGNLAKKAANRLSVKGRADALQKKIDKRKEKEVDKQRLADLRKQYADMKSRSQDTIDRTEVDIAKDKEKKTQTDNPDQKKAIDKDTERKKDKLDQERRNKKSVRDMEKRRADALERQ